jgi:hypothetical protein
MVNYQTITALVNQIPAGTWDVLREIKERRPAMMLSELMQETSIARTGASGTTIAYLIHPHCDHC